jgi:hypothetical protein
MGFFNISIKFLIDRIPSWNYIGIIGIMRKHFGSLASTVKPVHNGNLSSTEILLRTLVFSWFLYGIEPVHNGNCL